MLFLQFYYYGSHSMTIKYILKDEKAKVSR